jgi:hypothetical protein
MGKVVSAEVFLSFAEDMEQLIEVLSSEIPIESPRRQNIEQALKNMRATISEFRAALKK